MNPIYSFMDEYERDMAVANRELSIAMTEATIREVSNIQQLRINMALSELKVMEENGTAEDLAILIMEAGEEAAQQNEGIISKVFSAIASFFQSIANGLKNFFSKNKQAMDAAKKANATVELDGETGGMLSLLGKAAPHIEAAGNATDNHTFWKALATAAGVFTVSFGLYKAKGILFDGSNKAPKTKMSVAEAEQKANWLSSLLDKLKTPFEKKAQNPAPVKDIGIKDGNQDVKDKLAESKKYQNMKAGANKRDNEAKIRHQTNEQLVQTAMGAAGDISRGDISRSKGNKVINTVNSEIEKRDSAKSEGPSKRSIEREQNRRKLDQYNAIIKKQLSKGKSDEAAKQSAGQQVFGNPNFDPKTMLRVQFIGDPMFEAGGNEDEDKESLNFLQKMISWIADTLKGSIDVVLKKFGHGAGQVAADTVKGAVNGAANAVADATKPEKKGLFGKKFIGDEEDDESEEMEESAGFDVDPIEAMLSSLAFGGYSG